MLLRHRADKHRERLAAGSAWQDTGRVFVWPDGSPVRPAYVYHQFVSLTRAAGLPAIPFHGLRHSHVTALFDTGAHPKDVQERLGHHSAAFTMNVYPSVIRGSQRDAVERLSDRIVGRPFTGR